MNNLTPLKKELMIIRIKYFIAKYQKDLFEKSLIPKILSTFENKHKILWENFFKKTLSKHNLGFKNEEEYLKEYKLSKEQVIENSIRCVLTDLDEWNDPRKCRQNFNQLTPNIL